MRKPTCAVRFWPDVRCRYCGLVSTVVMVQFGELNTLNSSAIPSRATRCVQQKITLPHRVALGGVAELFNVFNSPNWTITTVETSPQYLQRTSGQNRTAQVGFRITF